jgi:hypothetical protein
MEKRMKWDKEFPTAPGWYWVKHLETHPNGKPYLIKENNTGNPNKFWLCGQHGEMVTPVTDLKGCEFQGPIFPVEE